MNKRQSAAIEAADHLIGNLLYNYDALPLIVGRLAVDAMPGTSARVVYDVMCDLFKSTTRRLSAAALTAELATRKIESGYVENLQAKIMVEDTAALVGYADTINDAASLRLADDIASRMQAEARSGETSAETVIANAMQAMTDAGTSAAGVEPISEIAKALGDAAERWRSGKVSDGLKTGFTDMDKLLSLRKGELMILAGRPSMGKSALAFDIVINAARQMKADGDKGTVVIFSAEMSKESVASRFACSIAGVNSHRIRRNKATTEEWRKFHRAIEELEGLPIDIDDTASPTSEQIFYRAAMLNAQKPVRLLVFDFLELIGDRAQSEELRVGGAASSLKAIAKTLDIPVLALSQLSRKVDERGDKLPVLADLRYSGNIEAVSDVVAFIMRPEYYFERNQKAYVQKEEHKTGVAYVFLSKHRNGPVGTVALSFVSHHAKFGNLTQERS